MNPAWVQHLIVLGTLLGAGYTSTDMAGSPRSTSSPLRLSTIPTWGLCPSLAMGMPGSLSPWKIQGRQLHIVHTKNNLSMDDALKYPEGIAVLAFFLQATAHARPSHSWDSFTQHLKKVALKGEDKDLDGSFSLRGLLGSVDLARYYRYQGSLTTPNCDEVVVWTVFPDPILVPPGVVTAFTSMLRSTDSSDKLQNNYRPLQSLGDRQVEASAALRVSPSSSSTPRTAALIPLLSITAITWQL
nr:carbonic anhydrase 15-like [Chelonoidis abingdonii]